MKKLARCLTYLICSMVTSSLVAQGTINWNNTASTLISLNGSSMPVRVSPETTYYFGLFVAPFGTPAPTSIYDPNWEFVAAYGTNSTAAAGAGRMQNPGIAALVGFDAGSTVNFIVRAWQSTTGGADWPAARSGLIVSGQSALGTAVLGGGPYPVAGAFGPGAGQISGFGFGCLECTPPVFAVYPTNTVVSVGGNATFYAFAHSYFPVIYQWYKGGTNIGAGSYSTLTLTNVTPSNAGDYTVVASNPFGMRGSPVFTLTVVTPATAATLGSPAYTANNQFQFTVTGSAGSNYVVQVATNLSAPTAWISLFTNASPFTFVDSNANDFLQRFYRAFAP
jgi:hypothetical protein